MSIEQLIAQSVPPNQNSLLDMYLTAEKLKNYRSTNALNEAKARELPYERERLTRLNDAKVSKTTAEAGKTDYELAEKKLLFMTRFPKDRNAVLGLFAEQAQTYPHLTPIYERLAQTQDPDGFAREVTSFAMDGLEKLQQARADEKFAWNREQDTIDNQFQQGNLNVAQGHLGVSRANAAETRRHHGVMENKPQSGFSMTTNPDGTMSLNYGTPAKNELEKKVINEEDAIARLDEIEKNANSRNLTYQNQARNAILDVKSKLGGEMTPQEKAFRDSMTDTRQATLTNLNKTIHELSGTAMGVKEAERIMATMPNMDDAPDVFDRKLQNSMRLTREAIARHKGALGQQPGPLPDRQAGLPPNTPRTAPTAVAEPPITMKDLEYTAAKHGITIEEVKRRMDVR